MRARPLSSCCMRCWREARAPPRLVDVMPISPWYLMSIFFIWAKVLPSLELLGTRRSTGRREPRH